LRRVACDRCGIELAMRSAGGSNVVSYLLTSAALALVILFGASSAASADTPAQLGEKLYAAQRCSMCHSIAGKGNAKGPLDHVGSKLSADDIRSWMTDAQGMTAKTKSSRKPFMKSYPKLQKVELDALVAYMQNLK
jgi:mono/diheme cytochrome c family protein